MHFEAQINALPHHYGTLEKFTRAVILQFRVVHCDNRSCIYVRVTLIDSNIFTLNLRT